MTRLLREWDGLRVRLRNPMKTKGGLYAEIGAEGTISTSGRTASFKVDSCTHCKCGFFVMGISKDSMPILFEVIAEKEPQP